MGHDISRLPLLGALIAAASCASARAADPLALYPATPESQQARVQGTLTMEGACLYIVSEGGERWLAAFPSPGTRWEAGENAVAVGDRRIRVGEAGAFAGGEVTNAGGTFRWVQAPAPACDASRLWMVSTLMNP